MEYRALSHSSDNPTDKQWLSLKVGDMVWTRLRWIEPLHPRATEEEAKWYAKTCLNLIPSKDRV